MNEDVLETAAAELECLRRLRGGRRPVLMLGPFDSLRQWVRCKMAEIQPQRWYGNARR